MIEIGLL